MKVERVASYPLIVHDPYFSIWSPNEKLYDSDTTHWSGESQKIWGYVTINETIYSFLGDKEFHNSIEQKEVEVTATSTTYVFENEEIVLRVCFCSPLLLDDLLLVSRPCTYIDFNVQKKIACNVTVDFLVSSDLVQRTPGNVIGDFGRRENDGEKLSYNYVFMGRAYQQPLGNSGDNITIDWGYVYLASQEKSTILNVDLKHGKIGGKLTFEEKENQGLIIAFDDLLSIHYFGQWRKGYWTNYYDNILEAIGCAFADKASVIKRAEVLDEEVYEKAFQAGGEEYAFLCNMSYRHAIAAHKLVTDEDGEVIFLSKENDSNGCIGTVDISYPSAPLFLLYDTEYVKGMLRPIFKFASCDVWKYDFAPHDVGRYPYAWGQVYGLEKEQEKYGSCRENGALFPPFYLYPGTSHAYDETRQMPVEECGNMLILTAAVCIIDETAKFAKPHVSILEQWADYLLKFGADPGEQLCTDDFAGHFSHNTNLSIKAIVGIEAFAQIERMMGDDEKSAFYHEKAVSMAREWELKALADDHYVLAFDKKESWSLKYNLVWDRFFGSNLFSKQVYEKELEYYLKKQNIYGTPLDNRKEYTKSDWIIWCVALTDDIKLRKKLLGPVAKYLKETKSRFPFSDWYETVTGEYCHFKGRSVQGGIYMPVLMDLQSVKNDRKV